MKRLFLIGCLLLAVNWGQAQIILEGVDLFEKDQIILTGLSQSNVINFSVRQGFTLESVVNTVRTAFAQQQWIHIESSAGTGVLRGKIVFRVDANETGKSRVIVFRSLKNSILMIGQDALPTLYNISCSNYVVTADHPAIINLSGSSTDCSYILKREGAQVETKKGTGQSITFTGVYPPGTYKIYANAEGSLIPMNGQVVLENYSHLAAVLHFLPNRLGDLDASGDIISFKTPLFTGEIDDAYREQFLDLINYCNTGKVSTWDPAVSITIGTGLLGFQIMIAPNLSASVRTCWISLTGSENKELWVQQNSNGTLNTYTFHADKKNLKSGEIFSISLENSQPFVVYKLYLEDVCIKEMIGTGESISFKNLNRLGLYRIQACWEGQARWMNGQFSMFSYEDCPVYMSEYTYLDEVNSVVNNTFYDNLGRQIQSVACQASPSGKDIITPIVYDEVGRISRNYLPYAIQGDGMLRRNALQEQGQFYTSIYGNEHYAYSDIIYDNSPSDQVLEQSSPGKSWRLGGGHTVHFAVRMNTSGDQIRRYQLTGTSLQLNGTWPSGSLKVNQVIDAEGREAYEFKDIKGLLIAKESRISATEKYQTYYVYDDLGRLRYVLPPIQSALFTSGSKTLTELSKYCYYNEYDKKGRIYKQYVPGAGYVMKLYDKRGRLVLTQDAVQRMKSPQEWSFTKYDLLDRPVISGICTGSESEHTTALNAQVIFGETRGTVLHGYTNNCYPKVLNSSNCLAITYYDDYSWNGETTLNFSVTDALGGTKSEEVTEMITGSKTKVLGASSEQWLVAAIYYDAQYHEIQQVKQLYPSGKETVSNVYNFVGQVVRSKVKQTLENNTTEEYNKYFSYDSQGRLLNIEQQINGDQSNNRVRLVSFEYDDLGRLRNKKLHNDTYNISYAYKVGGQLRDSKSRNFTYQLSYDSLSVTGGTAIPKYDGNISCFCWGASQNVNQAYSYTYDGLGQLKQASYNQYSGNVWNNTVGKYTVGNITYDLNGNLKTLTRNNNSGGVLHALNYNYDLSDNGNAISRIALGGSTSGNYIYDANGNLTTDGYSGNQIRYNVLNLPQEMTKGSEKISYIYSAAGEKLAMQQGSSLTFYRGEMVYAGSERYLLHPEGLIRKSSNGWNFHYNLKDHVGSTRVFLEAAGNTLTPVQTTDYYPFGLAFSTNNLNKNKYLFGGKEYQDGMLGGTTLGLYDFGARYYNPMLGRWFCQDPALQLMSPYAYCGNRPIYFTDPDGAILGVDDIIFAASVFVGAYLGGSMANDMNFNPVKWDWRSPATWAGMIGGGIMAGGTAVNISYGISLFGPEASTFSPIGTFLRWTSLTTQSLKYLSTASSLILDWDNGSRIFLGQYSFNTQRSFGGQLLEAFSRTTWEGVQTWAGYTYSSLRNTLKKVDNVEFFDGATLVNDIDGKKSSWGMTLGNYINGQNMEASIKDNIFMHEYGHTLQGMNFGPLYVFVVGLPSIGNEIFHSSNHNTRWYEKQANRFALPYFKKFYGDIKWNYKKYPNE